MRKGAGFFIYQVTVEDLENHPLDEFFPTKFGYDKRRYPTRGRMKRMFLEAGFTFEYFHTMKKEDRPIDRAYLGSIENLTLDSVLKMIKDDDPQAFYEGVERVKKGVERAESTGHYRVFSRTNRKVFWGIKR